MKGRLTILTNCKKCPRYRETGWGQSIPGSMASNPFCCYTYDPRERQRGGPKRIYPENPTDEEILEGVRVAEEKFMQDHRPLFGPIGEGDEKRIEIPFWNIPDWCPLPEAEG